MYEEREMLKGLVVRLLFIPLFERMSIFYLIESSKYWGWDLFMNFT